MVERLLLLQYKDIESGCAALWFGSNTCNVIVIITENILAVIMMTFKYFKNAFGYLLKKSCSPLETN